MSSVTIRDLRNHGGRVVDRVMAGESLVVTRSGRPVAELRPARQRGLTRDELVGRRRALPSVDPRTFRADLDRLVDPDL